MPTKTNHLQLPFRFSPDKLRADLETLNQQSWLPHFNTAGYEGAWNAIALYAPDGDADNILAMQVEERPMLPTPALELCSYFQEVIAQFDTRVLSARLLRLSVGANILPHRDYKLGYEDGCFRIHVPIITNPKVYFILDGVRLDMQPGECWYTNVNCEHSVRNEGDIDRIHLVIDFERNAWSDALFFGLAPKESFDAEEADPQYSVETLQNMIHELQKINSTTADTLVAQWQAKLKTLQADNR